MLCPPAGAKKWGAGELIFMQQWEIVEDGYRASLGQTNPYRLNLWRWDGAPVNPLYRVDSKPRMNPTTSGAGAGGNANEVKKTIRGSGAGSRVMERMIERVEQKMGEVDVDLGEEVWTRWVLGPGMLFIGVVGLWFS